MDGRIVQCTLEKMMQNRSRRAYRIECLMLQFTDIDVSVFYRVLKQCMLLLPVLVNLSTIPAYATDRTYTVQHSHRTEV